MAKRAHSIPLPALVLGLGGLIPFFASATVIGFPGSGRALFEIAFQSPTTVDIASEAAMQNLIQQKAGLALGAYAAVILSFLGGVRWGNLLTNKARLREWRPLTLSVVPSLIAWPALLLPLTWMLSVLAAGLVLQYALDVEALRRKELPIWFGRLRLILTTGAVVSLVAGLLALSLS